MLYIYDLNQHNNRSLTPEIPPISRMAYGLLVVILTVIFQHGARGEAPPPSPTGPDSSQEDVESYSPSFFQRYEPNTAFDMVRQIPGFQIDDGSNLRGFSSSAGNVLINNRRPSAKQDSLTAILTRIPADRVERIDLIRGQIPGVDLHGQTVVANIHLYSDIPASVRWEAEIRKHSHVKPLRPALNISISDHISNIDYNAGFSGFRTVYGDKGTSYIFDGTDIITEERHDSSYAINWTGNLFLNASMWAGETLLHANTKLGYIDRDENITFNHIPYTMAESPQDELYGDFSETRDFEIGLDAERSLSRDLSAKAILLLYNKGYEQIFEQRTLDANGDETLFRQADTVTDTAEIISRLEFDWLGWTNHALQANIEFAYNSLENSLAQIRDTGSGPETVDIPVSNTRVEEKRGNLLLKDTWSLSDWVLDYGIGAETSTISQSGDAEQERSFFFVKPEMLLTYSPAPRTQNRFRLAREVDQLNFNDFVSATVFIDDDLALGNPNLRPSSSWQAEFSHERRFGELTALTVTVFHHWLSSVQDLLPITDEYEAPGNIGNGRRWGIEFDGTIPLEWMGLTGARLDVLARWQDSRVTDPVTGKSRVLTAAGGFVGIPVNMPFYDDNKYAYSVDYRQDFREARVAWGWTIIKRAKRPRFKVNELDTFSESEPLLDLFIETTRWFDIKMGIEASNLLDLGAKRDRIIFTGQRDISPVNRRELREHSKARRYTVYMSGSF